jgi:hypothetical protein
LKTSWFEFGPNNAVFAEKIKAEENPLPSYGLDLLDRRGTRSKSEHIEQQHSEISIIEDTQ